MKNKIIIYIIALTMLLITDVVWFSVSLDNLYNPLMGAIIAPKPNFYAAILFYLLYSFGLCFFVIWPHMKNNKLLNKSLAASAAIFGVVAYGTFDLTSLAIISGFSAIVAIVDIFWGGLAAVLICMITLKIATKLKLQ